MNEDKGAFDIEVITTNPHHADKLTKFRRLKPLFEEALAQGAGMSLMTYPTSEQSLELLAKRRHDLKAALRTMEHSISQLEGGYRFDDRLATEKIASMRRALGVIAKDAALFMRLLEVE